jgi:hypothetical protein
MPTGMASALGWISFGVSDNCRSRSPANNLVCSVTKMDQLQTALLKDLSKMAIAGAGIVVLLTWLLSAMVT